MALSILAAALVPLSSGAPAQAPDAGGAPPVAGGRVPASRTVCETEVIPWVTVAAPGDAVLTGRRDVPLRSVRAFRVSKPERVRFSRFEPFTMRGVLSDGCPFAFWWTGNPIAFQNGEIRVSQPEELSGSGWTFIGHSPGPEPSWTPSVAGYRYVMSAAVSPSGPYIGLWLRTDGSPGSLVAHFGREGEPVTRLGTASRMFDAVYVSSTIHQLFFTLLEEPEGPAPLTIVTFEWVQRPPSRR